MKCPKCHYLSFEPEPRCKHCGYSFSLSEPDLPIRPAADDSDDGPLADFPIRDADIDRSRGSMTLGPMRAASQGSAAAGSASALATFEPPAPAPDFPAEPPRPRAVRPAPTTELPLFVKGLADAEAGAVELPPPAEGDRPFARVLPAARPPLAVRRPTEAPRPQLTTRADAQPARKLGPFDHDLLEDLQRIEAKASGRPAPARDAAAGTGDAVRRLTAAGIDLVFLGAINASIVWFTLRQCDLTWQQALALPLGPMAGFLAMVIVGYLFLFTAASGQTIGKMLVGLRVVADPDTSGSDAPTLRQASYRALLTLPSVLVLGAGFLPALIRPGLAVHDRLAHTRVIRA